MGKRGGQAFPPSDPSMLDIGLVKPLEVGDKGTPLTVPERVGDLVK